MKKLTAFLVTGLLALPVFAQQPKDPETPSPILHSTVFTAQGQGSSWTSAGMSSLLYFEASMRE